MHQPVVFARLRHAEHIRADVVDGAADLRVAVIDIPCAVVFARFFNFFRTKAEDEDVLFTDFVVDLHIGAVHRADGQCAVEHQFHIARSGSLRSRQ